MTLNRLGLYALWVEMDLTVAVTFTIYKRLFINRRLQFELVIDHILAVWHFCKSLNSRGLPKYFYVKNLIDRVREMGDPKSVWITNE